MIPITVVRRAPGAVAPAAAPGRRPSRQVDQRPLRRGARLRPDDPVRPGHGRRDGPHGVRPAAAEHPRRLRPRQRRHPRRSSRWPRSSGLSLQVPIAQMADRRKRTRLMLHRRRRRRPCFSVGTGLAFSVWMLVIVRSGFGIGQATVGPTHNALLADYFPIGNRPRVFSFHRGANAVGAFVGPIVAGLLAAALSWRAPFIVFAIPMFILVLLGLRLQRAEPGHPGAQGDGRHRRRSTPRSRRRRSPRRWRMVWKIESLRRIFYALPFLAASLIGFVVAGRHPLRAEVRARRGRSAAGWRPPAEPVQLVGLVIGARIGTKLMVRDPGLVIRFIAVVAFVTAGLLGAVRAVARTCGWASSSTWPSRRRSPSSGPASSPRSRWPSRPGPGRSGFSMGAHLRDPRPDHAAASSAAIADTIEHRGRACW